MKINKTWKMKQPKFWQPIYRMAPRNLPNHQTPPHLDPQQPYIHHPLDPYHPRPPPNPDPKHPLPPDPHHPYLPDPHHSLPPTTPSQSFVLSFGHYSMGRTT